MRSSIMGGNICFIEPQNGRAVNVSMRNFHDVAILAESLEQIQHLHPTPPVPSMHHQGWGIHKQVVLICRHLQKIFLNFLGGAHLSDREHSPYYVILQAYPVNSSRVTYVDVRTESPDKPEIVHTWRKKFNGKKRVDHVELNGSYPGVIPF